MKELQITCDHNGKGMYWCRICEPSMRELSEYLGLAVQQRDRLLEAARSALTSLSQTSTYQIPPIVLRDVADMLNRVNQELNLP